MGVINLPSGRPTMLLTGGAAAHLKHITPDGHEARIDLTLTDDFPLAQAIVIISALPVKTDCEAERNSCSEASQARRHVICYGRREMAIAGRLWGQSPGLP